MTPELDSISDLLDDLLPESNQPLGHNYLADVVLHVDRVNWLDPGVTPDSVTRQFIGKVAYWKLPQFSGMEPVDIERSILADADVEEWAGASPWKPYYQHFLTLLKLLLPNTDITPNLADACMMFVLGMGHGRKGTNLIGCQNSGKSAVTARIVMTCMAINPDINFALVANPYKTSAESTIWGDFKEVFQEIQDNHPNLWPEAKPMADKRLILKKVPKAGYVEIRPVDEVGKFKGTKTKKVRRPNGKYVTPIFIIAVDEVNEVKSGALLKVLSNTTSQDGFHCFTSQNFKDIADMGGRLTEPRGLYGGPNAFDELTKADRYWHSFSSSVTLRFNGLESPNFKAKREIYPYLFRRKNLMHIIETYGINSPEYYSQVLSFPIDSAEIVSVISSSSCRRARVDDTHYSIHHRKGKVAFGDPSFGGGDLCLVCWAEIADCKTAGPDGVAVPETLFTVPEQMRRVPLNRELKVNDEWFARLKAVEHMHRIDKSNWIPDTPVTFEDQIALYWAEFCVKNGIPYENFGYDFSLRHEIINSVHRIMGPKPVSFGYNEAPKGFYLRGLKKNSTDVCGDRVTELCFMAADMLQTKQVRGGALQAGITQLSRTLFKVTGEKRWVEKKVDYKKRWTQVSPDARDVFVGMVGMAAMRGFVLNNPLTGSSKGAKTPGNNPPPATGFLRLKRPAKL